MTIWHDFISFYLQFRFGIPCTSSPSRGLEQATHTKPPNNWFVSQNYKSLINNTWDKMATEGKYESILCVKPDVNVYRIPPRATNRGYR